MAKRGRGNGEGTIYRRKDGRWCGQISYVDINGKRRRKSTVQDKRADVVAKLNELRKEALRLSTTSYPSASRLTLGEYLRQWLTDVVDPELRANTRKSYRQTVEKHIIPGIGSVPIRSLLPMHVDQFLATMQRAGTGARTRQMCFVILSTALKRAVHPLAIIESNPCASLNRPKCEREQIFPFDADEARAILAEAKGDRYEGVYVLAIQHGMREAEIFGLRWPNVDLEHEKLHIREQLIDLDMSFQPPKTKAGIRSIELTELAVDALHDCHLRRFSQDNPAMVFTAASGGLIHQSNFRQRHWGPLLKRLDLTHRGFHHCRHTYATLALAAGVDVSIVSKVLGHAKTSVTLDIYQHIMPGDTRKAADVMDDLFRTG